MTDKNKLIIIRGAGDLASGVAVKLHNEHYAVIMLETEEPTVIRRSVSFAQAVFSKKTSVENVKGILCSKEEALSTALSGTVAVVVDPDAESVKELKPGVLVDAIIAKRNTGTTKDMAAKVIALGPGFRAGKDCDAVIETQRGPNLGKVIYNGCAEPNTGIPGMIGGYSTERVIHSPCRGTFRSAVQIGDMVCENSIVAYVDDTPVYTVIAGKVRGMLMDGLYVPQGFKVADVDPRGESADHTRCSDKAVMIAEGVYRAITDEHIV